MIWECIANFLYFRILIKSIKWYRRVLFHFIDLAVVNAFILKKAVTQEKLSLYLFKLEVARALMHADSLSNPTSVAALLLQTAAAPRYVLSRKCTGISKPGVRSRSRSHSHSTFLEN